MASPERGHQPHAHPTPGVGEVASNPLDLDTGSRPKRLTTATTCGAPGASHAGCGTQAEETHREQSRQGAPVRPNNRVDIEPWVANRGDPIQIRTTSPKVTVCNHCHGTAPTSLTRQGSPRPPAPGSTRSPTRSCSESPTPPASAPTTSSRSSGGSPSASAIP